MPRNTRRGAIPSDLGWLVDELDDYRNRIETLEQPTGSQTKGNSSRIDAQIASLTKVVTYLASLRSHNDTGANFTLSNQPSDGTFRYFSTGAAQPEATEVTVACPTGKMIVSAALGEASVTPPMGYCITEIAVRVTDANGVNMPVGTVGCFARLYTNMRFGQSLRTNDALVTITDPIANPGPYRVRLVVGVWGAAGNLGLMTVAVNQPSITVQIIGDGVPA